MALSETGPASLVAWPVRAVVRTFRRARDHYVPQNFGEIVPGRIYRSGRLSANAVRVVAQRYGIRTIVDLGAGRDAERDRADELEAIRALGMRRAAFHLTGDGRGKPSRYADALRIVADPASHPVLVHCAAGANRTSTLAVLYLTLCRGMTFDAAAATCLRHGCDLSRRPEHLAYLREHFDEIAAEFRAAPIPQAPEAVAPDPVS